MLVAKKPNLESVTTINEDGSRPFLHPADVKGRFTRWRRVFGALLLGIYVGLPWIPVNGYPAVFFDIAELRFHFFGLTFLTQDLWLAFFLLSGLGFGLFYVTALLGRLWCGWACPYTVFLEHVYRRIERFIEGDAPARRLLDQAPWTSKKITRRVIKHGLYVIVSALIAHVFLSYFISIPKLYEYMHGSPLDHVKAFGVVAFLTGALYFSFSWFREQFCIILCPYGRIQSALTDDNTMIIGYDAKRGEPRGKVSSSGHGDCIDCLKCVHVCPTGIDIRNGLQLECIGCSACIDACDSIMDKVKRPRGLVRYDSMNGLAGKKTKILRPRIFVYTALMLMGVTALSIFMMSMHSSEAVVFRMPGPPYYVTEEGVRNQYRIRMYTKRNTTTTFKVKVTEPKPEGLVVSGLDGTFEIEPQGELLRPFMVQVPRQAYDGGFILNLEVTSHPGGVKMKRAIEFLGPSPYVLSKEETSADQKSE